MDERGVKKCPMQMRTCSVHGFVHGNEAEQLRAGIEKMMGDPGASGIYLNCEDRTDWDQVTEALQKLLDNTDAHDSLAFLENQDRARARKASQP